MTRGLLVVRTGGPEESASELITRIAALGTVVREGYLGRGRGSGIAASTTSPGLPQTPHLLRAAHTPSRWRRPLLWVADGLAPRGARARYAVRFDPWFRARLREADALVVLGPGAEAVVGIAMTIAPQLPRHTGVAGLRVAARQEARARLEGASTGATLGPAGTHEVLNALTLLHETTDQDPRQDVDHDLRQHLLSLPGAAPGVGEQARLLEALAALVSAEEPVLRAWSARHRLDSGAEPQEDLGDLAGQVLSSVDPAPGSARGTSPQADALHAGRAELALGLLFHPQAHDTASALLEDPESVLAPVRRTRLWQTLTSPNPQAPSTHPDRADAPNLSVHLLPGPDVATKGALRDCLRVAPTVAPTVWKGSDLPARLRGSAPSAYLVRARLTTSTGQDWAPDDALATLLRGPAAPDVLLVHRADRTALAATLLVRPPTRLVLRVDAADLSGPWIHLIDWGRVETVLVDRPTVRDQLHRLVGEPARSVPARVLDLGAPHHDQIREVLLGDLWRLVHLSAQRQHEEAVELARQVLADPAATSPLLQQAAQSATRAGEVSLRLEILRRWAQAPGGPHPTRLRLVRQQEGRLRELTPGWLPGDLPPTPVTGVPGRVLHLLKASLPHRTSGYAVRSFYLLREQARAGTDVVAATALDFPEDGAPDTEVVGEVTHRRLLREQVPDSENRDDYQAAFARALLDVVTEHRPAVLHAHSGHRGYDLVLIALAVGRATGIPVVYEVRGLFEAVWTSDVSRATSSELYRLRSAMEAHCLGQADAVVTLSESMRQELVSRSTGESLPPGSRPLDPDRVFVVPNGVDPASIQPRARRDDLVTRHGLGDTFTFGYVSNLDHPREGQELLVEVVAILRGRGLAASAVLVGGGERRESLEALAAQLEVAEHVVFTGPVPHEEVGDYYALLDVFVVPRIDERAARLVTPLKPYEAMSMGLPVVVSDLPALREIIGSGERGLAFPPGDAEALAEVLDSLMRDAARRRQLATAGQEWVREHRTWAALASGYDAVYARASAAADG